MTPRQTWMWAALLGAVTGVVVSCATTEEMHGTGPAATHQQRSAWQDSVRQQQQEPAESGQQSPTFTLPPSGAEKTIFAV